MKFLCILTVICAVGSLSAMDYNHNACLSFLLNKDYSVKGVHAQDLNYRVPSEFLGKNIFDTINFNEDGEKALTMGFLKAVKQNRTVSIAYPGPDNHQGLATITPIMKKTKNNFFVKIEEL